MKILMVSFTFPPNKDGVSEASSAVVAGYRGMGWTVDVLTQPSSEHRETMEWQGARIIEYERPHAGVIDIDGKQITPVDFIKNGNWDVVFFQTYDLVFDDCLPRIDEIRARKVLISHGFPGLVWYRVSRFPFGLPSMFRRCWRGSKMISWLRKFDCVVYLSEYADVKGFYDHWLAKLSKYPGRRIIPNGVNLNERGTDPQGFRVLHGIPDDTFLFLCVANYSPRKDQAYAARAFRKAAIPNSRLVFIGSEINKHAEKFMAVDRALAAPNEENHVLWLEKIDRSSTLDALESCDAFVLSALHEAQPISLLEAMRAGKPWVARKSGCIQIMEGGICVTSVTAMAKAMNALAKDPKLQNRLASAGSEAVAKNYNRDTYTQRYIALAEELLVGKNEISNLG